MFRLMLLEMLAICLILSCKKPSSINENNTSLQDTLSAGWTMSKIKFEQFSNIRFVQNNGIAVSGTAIYVSDNGGESWLKSNSNNYPIGFRGNIGMDSVGNVIIGSVGYPLALSQDYNNFTFLQDNFVINDNWFVKNSIAYAITTNRNGTDINFLQTINGGSTWDMVSVLPQIGPLMEFGPTHLSFINSQIGWTSTPYAMFKTTTGGLTWSNQYKPAGMITNISAIDANTCYIVLYELQPTPGVVKNTVLKTTDGGTSWQEVFSKNYLPGESEIKKFQFVNATTGYMVRGNWIYKSNDGGVNWKEVVYLNSSNMFLFTDIYFSDANHGWACSSEGHLLRYKQ
jgi:photosystem II stability/assembly factor-like uncharacterized protein